MNLEEAMQGAGSETRSRRILEDFQRMGIPPTSPVADVGRRIEDPKVPWNVRAALLMTVAEAGLTSVADSLPSILATLLERDMTFEDLQVLESAWWMCGEFSTRYRLADLISWADRSLESSARNAARNLDNMLCAAAEAVVACGLGKSTGSMDPDVAQWLSGMRPQWLLKLHAGEVLTADAERFHRLAAGKDVRAARRILSDWLTENVKQPPPHSSPADSETSEA